MVFLVDFVVPRLSKGLDIGALYWISFALSAAGGSLFMGWLDDQIGFRFALRLVFAGETAAVLLLGVLSTT